MRNVLNLPLTLIALALAPYPYPRRMPPKKTGQSCIPAELMGRAIRKL